MTAKASPARVRPSLRSKAADRPGRLPPGRNPGLFSNVRTIPVNDSENSSVLTTRGPVAGSLRWTVPRPKPSTTRKWLNRQNTIIGRLISYRSSGSRRKPCGARPYDRAARITFPALLPSREIPHAARSSSSGTNFPK